MAPKVNAESVGLLIIAFAMIVFISFIEYGYHRTLIYIGAIDESDAESGIVFSSKILLYLIVLMLGALIVGNKMHYKV